MGTGKARDVKRVAVFLDSLRRSAVHYAAASLPGLSANRRERGGSREDIEHSSLLLDSAFSAQQTRRILFFLRALCC